MSGYPDVAGRHRALPVWLALLLACALLWAQWAGLAHRIEHGLGAGAVHAAHAAGAGESTDASPAGLHSCVMFDGLCLADSLPSARLPLLPVQAAHGAPHETAFASWQAGVAWHFQPRAPPAA